VPLIFHSPEFGRLFIRSSWEENAKWLGYFGGELQVFEDGRPSQVNPETSKDPIQMAEALVLPASFGRKFKLTLEEEQLVFVLGLKPRTAYEIEVDDEEMREESTDPGGILSLQLPAKLEVGVRLRESKK